MKKNSPFQQLWANVTWAEWGNQSLEARPLTKIEFPETLNAFPVGGVPCLGPEIFFVFKKSNIFIISFYNSSNFLEAYHLSHQKFASLTKFKVRNFAPAQLLKNIQVEWLV